MKSVVSYVSGTGGDFVVNCCNHVWSSTMTQQGSVIPSASTKDQENQLNDADWVKLVNNLPYSYVGTHLVDRLLRLPVNPIWLTVPDLDQYRMWAMRDFVTRYYKKMLVPHGDLFDKIKDLVLANQSKTAAGVYLDYVTKYNWSQMQMRLVQMSNKINVSQLLRHNGIDEIIDQLPELKSVSKQCRVYHKVWLSNQVDLTESSVIDLLSAKLCKFVEEIKE